MKHHADYRIIGVTDEFVFLLDINRGHISITNDAEWVVEQVIASHGDRRIIYKDTQGEWDELYHDGTRFIEFRPYVGWRPN